jgi:hypothetical protein
VLEQVREYEFPQRDMKGLPDSPLSLMEGTAGDILFLIDVLRLEGGFPGFDDI